MCDICRITHTLGMDVFETMELSKGKSKCQQVATVIWDEKWYCTLWPGSHQTGKPVSGLNLFRLHSAIWPLGHMHGGPIPPLYRLTHINMSFSHQKRKLIASKREVAGLSGSLWFIWSRPKPQRVVTARQPYNIGNKPRQWPGSDNTLTQRLGS